MFKKTFIQLLITCRYDIKFYRQCTSNLVYCLWDERSVLILDPGYWRLTKWCTRTLHDKNLYTILKNSSNAFFHITTTDKFYFITIPLPNITKQPMENSQFSDPPGSTGMKISFLTHFDILYPQAGHTLSQSLVHIIYTFYTQHLQWKGPQKQQADDDICLWVKFHFRLSAENGIRNVLYHLYSPDWAPCNFSAIQVTEELHQGHWPCCSSGG